MPQLRVNEPILGLNICKFEFYPITNTASAIFCALIPCKNFNTNDVLLGFS
jgi:hypothetical protein